MPGRAFPWRGPGRGGALNLRTRLLLVVFAALLGSTLILLHAWTRQQRLMLVEMETHVLRLTRLVAREDEQLLGSTKTLLSVLSLLPEVRQGDACGPLLWRILEEHPIYANLGVVDTRGNLVCSAVRTDAPTNLAHRDFFRGAMAQGQFSAGSYGIEPATGKAVVYFGQPLRGSDGRSLGVVFASLELRWLNGFATQVDIPEGSVITAYDRQGTVLARYPDSEDWVGRSIADAPFVQASFQEKMGVVQARGPRGMLLVHAFMALETGPADNPLFLSIDIPRDTLEDSARQVLLRDLMLLWGAGAAAFFLLYVAGRVLVVRPMERLVHVANRLGAGDLSARSELPYGPDELGRLARSFDAMAGSLDAAVRTREEFLEVASHELKTPLASLKLQLQSALRSLKGRQPLAPGQLEDRLHFAERQVWRLSQLVEQMVDVKTVAEGGLHPVLERVDLVEVVRQVVGGLTPPLARADTPVVVHADAPVLGWWDRRLLEKVLGHLLSNALKFGQGRPVEVTVVAEGPLVRLSVKDRGIGIALEEQARILGRFERAVPTRHFGGLGLGLWLVQKMVGVLRGSLTLRSEPGKGTECIIELPREPHLTHPEEDRTPDGGSSLHLI
ncbi:sensor histidine kinase [Archangium sp.]|uniref:sensor histidine kinase n=1 Tax=Archangium sp. TaxID=1872627 RepID=UPI002D3DBC2C|nr:ATP-binding protein [Archangium sp.]HYO57438.1 ATP-binding protein [Archangium sp.]